MIIIIKVMCFCNHNLRYHKMKGFVCMSVCSKISQEVYKVDKLSKHQRNSQEHAIYDVYLYIFYSGFH